MTGARTPTVLLILDGWGHSEETRHNAIAQANVPHFNRLWRDKLGQISLAVTTLFWGAGATLQFIVIKWSEVSLGLDLSKSSMLQGVVAVGVAIGVLAGAVQGFFGGRIDLMFQRFIEIWSSIPVLYLLLIISYTESRDVLRTDRAGFAVPGRPEGALPMNYPGRDGLDPVPEVSAIILDHVRNVASSALGVPVSILTTIVKQSEPQVEETFAILVEG